MIKPQLTYIDDSEWTGVTFISEFTDEQCLALGIDPNDGWDYEVYVTGNYKTMGSRMFNVEATYENTTISIDSKYIDAAYIMDQILRAAI